MKPFKKINSDSLDIEKLQGNVDAALSPLLQIPILNGNFIESVALVSGQANLVSHKLGRKARGWILARQSANSTVWEQTTTLSDLALNLWCSANCTVSLWVF